MAKNKHAHSSSGEVFDTGLNRINGEGDESLACSDQSDFRSYEILDGVFLFGAGNIERLVKKLPMEDREILRRYDTLGGVPPPIPPEIENKIPPEYRETGWHMAYYAEEIEKWCPKDLIEKIRNGTPLSRLDKYNHKLGPNLGLILRKIKGIENEVKRDFMEHVRKRFSARIGDGEDGDSDLHILL